MTRIGINGFGRIGRLFLKAGINNPNLDFAAVNDLAEAKTLAHLFKYDSIFGLWPGTVEARGSSLVINQREIEVVQVGEPSDIPWGQMGVDVVVESTGRFSDADKARGHTANGAKKVVVSAPSEGADITICMGINHNDFDPARHVVISNASCTTNCLAPLALLLHEAYILERGFITTVHAYTSDQSIMDLPHKDLRRARAAALSIIPTSTGAAKAIGLVIPQLKGRLNGMAVRVPVPDGSLTDLVAVVRKIPKDADEVNTVYKKAASGERLKGILQYCEEPIVSTDILRNPASCIFDAGLTMVEGKLVKVMGWYDNEWGYSNRLAELAAHIGARL